MCGLSQKIILDGELGFYLALLQTAAHLLRTDWDCFEQGNDVEDKQVITVYSFCFNVPGILQTTSDLQSLYIYFLPVLFLNERSSSLRQQIVPVSPGVTVKDVGKIISCRMSSRHTEEFAMYSLRAGKG